MEKPAGNPPGTSLFDEFRAAGLECTAEQCRHLYGQLVSQSELPRDIVTLFQNPQVRLRSIVASCRSRKKRLGRNSGGTRGDMSFAELCRAIKKEHRILDQRDLISMRFILDDNLRGSITKASLVRFLLWFWPLLPDEDLYETAEGKRPAKDTDDNYVTAHQYDRDETAFDDEGAPDDAEPPPNHPLVAQSSPMMRAISKTSIGAANRVYGWQVSEIAIHFLHKPWFHGFLSASQARERLQNEKAGTFLLRFSSVPPHFALDLQDGFRVRHWRIEHRHKERKLHIFMEEYESLEQIVEIHSAKPLRLASGSLAALLREGLSRIAWDPSLANSIITSDIMHRTSPQHAPAAVDAPWPPPADWST